MQDAKDFHVLVDHSVEDEIVFKAGHRQDADAPGDPCVETSGHCRDSAAQQAAHTSFPGLNGPIPTLILLANSKVPKLVYLTCLLGSKKV